MLQKRTTLIYACLLSLGSMAQADLTINPSINSPVDDCDLSSSETIACILVNISAFPYSGTLDMGYSLNAGVPVIESVTIGFMPASGTFIYSFPVDDDFSACQVHDLQIWVYDPNDPNNLNDTVSASVISDCSPTSGSITGPGILCAGINNGDLTLNGSVGVVNSWGSSTDGGTSWSWIPSTDVFFTYTNISNQTDFKVIVDSPFALCPSDTTEIHSISLDQLSDAGALPADFDICDNGNGGTVETVGYVGSVLDWLVSIDNGTTWSTEANSNNFTTYSNLTTTTLYKVIAKNGLCPADTSSAVTLTLIPGTAPGTITGDSFVCNFQNNSSLVATGGNGSVIAWYYSLDMGVTWLPTTDTDNTFEYSNLSLNTLFAAEWKFGSCPTETATHFITVLPIPTAVTPDMTINEGDALQLNASGGTSFLWWPNQDIDDVTSPNPTVAPPKSVTYFVEITDINGCSDTVSVMITVLPDLSSLIIPNLFTPNGDGYNDLWEIHNLVAFSANELTVFNIYGQVVYEAAPYNNDWGGTFAGNQLSDGTYFYLLRLNDPLYTDPVQGVITIAGND